MKRRLIWVWLGTILAILAVEGYSSEGSTAGIPSKVLSYTSMAREAGTTTLSLGGAGSFGGAGETILIPINVDYLPDDIIAVDIRLYYDASQFDFSYLQLGAVTQDWYLVYNADVPGTLRIGMYWIYPLAGDGNILNLGLTVRSGATPGSHYFSLVDATFNADVFPIVLDNGFIVLSTDVRSKRVFWYYKYASPGTVDVTVEIYNDGPPLSALALWETISAGWAFAAVVSPSPPGSVPEPGASGTLEFAWSDVPSFPVVLTYRLDVPAGQTGDKAFDGQVVFRQDGDVLYASVGSLLNISKRLYHSSDYNMTDYKLGLSELLRLIQFYNSSGYHVDPGAPDGYGAGVGSQDGAPHDSDYSPQDWRIGLVELLRLIQFYNSGAYHVQEGTADGFAPGP